MSDSKPRVIICCPSGDEVFADTSIFLTAMHSYALTQGISSLVIFQKRTVVSFARNDLVKRAIELGATHILFVDSDMVGPFDLIPRFLAHDKDIVCATYNRRVPPYSILGRLEGEGRNIRGGLHKAEFMPAGLMMIKTDVFKRLSYPWFFETYTWSAATPIASFISMLADWSMIDMPLSARTAIATSPALSQWLLDNQAETQRLTGDGSAMSEDYNFCRKARKAGFEIWTDFDVTFQSAHIGTHHVTCELAPEASMAEEAA